jgi:hypothetical protein
MDRLCQSVPAARYDGGMPADLERSRSKTPVVRKAAAGLVLVVVAALVVKLVLGLVLAVFWFVVVAAVIVAVLWALKTILW